MSGYGELEFDLPSSLLEAVEAHLGKIQAQTLTEGHAVQVPNEQGVYCLFYQDRLVYVGKTDGAAGLRSRLSRHARKLLGRNGLMPDDVSFKALRIFVFTAMDIEQDLIQRHGGVRALAWNGSGFGSNDPGKERDTTCFKDDHFDTMFPIDIDRCFVEIEPAQITVAEALAALKERLPYLLRYEKDHDDLALAKVSLAAGMTTRQVLALCISALPPGWHATALPSHIIAYKNDNRHFPSGTQIARS